MSLLSFFPILKTTYSSPSLGTFLSCTHPLPYSFDIYLLLSLSISLYHPLHLCLSHLSLVSCSISALSFVSLSFLSHSLGLSFSFSVHSCRIPKTLASLIFGSNCDQIYFKWKKKKKNCRLWGIWINPFTLNLLSFFLSFLKMMTRQVLLLQMSALELRQAQNIWAKIEPITNLFVIVLLHFNALTHAS